MNMRGGARDDDEQAGGVHEDSVTRSAASTCASWASCAMTMPRSLDGERARASTWASYATTAPRPRGRRAR
jgi:hypothetical protein